MFDNFSMKLFAFLLHLSMGMYFHLSPGHKKCIKEEIHKDVVVTGEFESKESPGHRVRFVVHERVVITPLSCLAITPNTQKFVRK